MNLLLKLTKICLGLLKIHAPNAASSWQKCPPRFLPLPSFRSHTCYELYFHKGFSTQWVNFRFRPCRLARRPTRTLPQASKSSPSLRTFGGARAVATFVDTYVPCNITIVGLNPGYHGRTRSTSWLLMLWGLYCYSDLSSQYMKA